MLISKNVKDLDKKLTLGQNINIFERCRRLRVGVMTKYTLYSIQKKDNLSILCYFI